MCRTTRGSGTVSTGMKGKSFLTSLISYDRMTHLVDEGQAMDVVYLDISKGFDIISHSILLEKLVACGLDRCTLHWVKISLGVQAQRVVVSSYIQLATGDPRAQFRSLTTLLMIWMRGWDSPSVIL